MSERVRVVIVDDHAFVRRAMRMLLDATADIEVVGEAADGAEAVRVTEQVRPDVVLMDIQLPVLDGIAAARQVIDQTSSKVVLLTTFDDDAYVFEGMEIGAAGFLLKNAEPDALLNGIRLAHAGHYVLGPEIRARVMSQVRPRRGGADAAEQLAGLTPREREVLVLLAQGHSNLEAAELLVVSETTVKSHVSNLLTKLDLRDRVQAVVFAYEQGLVGPGARPSSPER
ncbi:response regulator [Flexivirga meconopsidis]|uniref:response regulator n=1 Tax=Flexivirga meconopsidis TaxID=2977121 RepID=UPI00223F3BF7